MNISSTITDITAIIDEAEKLKGYWDDTGLDMHIAVKANKQFAVSTKHWTRVHYVQTTLEPKEVWSKIFEVSNVVGRKLIRSTKGPYVYINKLNESQTKSIFDKFVSVLGCTNNDVTRNLQYTWSIKDAILP